MTNFAKLLVALGLVIMLLGCFILLAIKFKIPLGKLPGDFLIQNKNFTFYFPLATSLVLSIIISAIIFLFSRK